jgi:hypothetical protein
MNLNITQDWGPTKQEPAWMVAFKNELLHRSYLSEKLPTHNYSFMKACATDDFPTVVQALQMGAEINTISKSFHALHLALLAKPFYKILFFLLDHPDITVNHTNKEGQSAGDYALEHLKSDAYTTQEHEQFYTLIKRLIKKGATFYTNAEFKKDHWQKALKKNMPVYLLFETNGRLEAFTKACLPATHIFQSIDEINHS